jgi:hypothetical protein
VDSACRRADSENNRGQGVGNVTLVRRISGARVVASTAAAWRRATAVTDSGSSLRKFAADSRVGALGATPIPVASRAAGPATAVTRVASALSGASSGEGTCGMPCSTPPIG